MEKIKLGIGFATGRKSFRQVLASYLASWGSSKELFPKNVDVELNLFVAYDVNYRNAKSTDFTNLSQEIVDSFESIVFVGAKNTVMSVEFIEKTGALSKKKLKDVFSSGYAGERNMVLYSAIEHGMDYLIFLDDDEYPMAVTHNKESALWSGQKVFISHLMEIENADITNGYHCGYISPIPLIKFDNTLTEDRFRRFIEAVSNDIINWESVKSLVNTGGVTYASSEVLQKGIVSEVPLINGCRFISGSNLCINLKNRTRIQPFYNPPGARGEDTFLSVLLSDRKVMRVPCYTFHDGFSYYKSILYGALPVNLAPITAENPKVIKRFLSACIGWVRYKPLLIYLTDNEHFEFRMKDIDEALQSSVHYLSEYFHEEGFLSIYKEFKKYEKNVKRHAKKFSDTQDAWKKMVTCLPAS